MSNSVLWETIEPKEGALLFEPMAKVRQHQARLAELQTLQQARNERLSELEAKASEPVDVFTDPESLEGVPSIDAIERLREIVAHLGNLVGKEKAAIARPKHLAESIWAKVAHQEKRWKTFAKQAETLEGHPAEVAAVHAKQARQALEDAYLQATGHKYSDKRPCGAVVTWEPGPEPTEIQKAIRKLKPKPHPWYKQEGDVRQFSTWGAHEEEWDEKKLKEVERDAAVARGHY